MSTRDTRYGVYLRPSPALCQAQAALHDLLQRQYGLRVAGTFMPHATIKGFFQATTGPETLSVALAPVLAGIPAFTAYNRGPIPFGPTSIVLDVQHRPDGSRNEAMHALHTAVFAAMTPYISPTCDFTPREGKGDWFFAHLTLAMADLRPELQLEVLDFITALAPVGPASFLADRLQLFRFTSADWAGAWWETMRWELLTSWQLPSTPPARPA